MLRRRSVTWVSALFVVTLTWLCGLASDCFSAPVFVPRPKPMTPHGSVNPPPRVGKVTPGTSKPGDKMDSAQHPKAYEKRRDSRTTAEEALKKAQRSQASNSLERTAEAISPVALPKVVPLASSPKCKDKNRMNQPCE